MLESISTLEYKYVFLVKSDQMDYCVQKIINSIKIWINFIFYQTNFFVSHVLIVVCNVRG